MFLQLYNLLLCAFFSVFVDIRLLGFGERERERQRQKERERNKRNEGPVRRDKTTEKKTKKER